jgi:hypothetical protein
MFKFDPFGRVAKRLTVETNVVFKGAAPTLTPNSMSCLSSNDTLSSCAKTKEENSMLHPPNINNHYTPYSFPIANSNTAAQYIMNVCGFYPHFPFSAWGARQPF